MEVPYRPLPCDSNSNVGASIYSQGHGSANAPTPVGIFLIGSPLATFSLDGGLVSFGLAEDLVLTAQVVGNSQVLAQTPNLNLSKA